MTPHVNPFPIELVLLQNSVIPSYGQNQPPPSVKLWDATTKENLFVPVVEKIVEFHLRPASVLEVQHGYRGAKLTRDEVGWCLDRAASIVKLSIP